VTCIGWWNTWPAEPVAGTMISMYAWPVETSGHANTIGTSDTIERGDFPGRTYPEDAYDRFRPFIRTERDLAPREWRALAQSPDVHSLWYLARDLSFADFATAELGARPMPDLFTIYLGCVDMTQHSYSQWAPWAQGLNTDPKMRARYGEAVPRIYEFADSVLGRLADAAGEGTGIIVVSDHGFEFGANGRYDHLDPDWSPPGTVVFSGGRFRPGATLGPITPYDLLPTVLAALNLPVGRDLPGRVVREAFSAPVHLTWTDTYDDDFTARARQGSTEADDAFVKRLRAIGYL